MTKTICRCESYEYIEVDSSRCKVPEHQQAELPGQEYLYVASLRRVLSLPDGAELPDAEDVAEILRILCEISRRNDKGRPMKDFLPDFVFCANDARRLVGVQT